MGANIICSIRSIDLLKLNLCFLERVNNWKKKVNCSVSIAGVQFGSEVLHKVQGGGRVSPKPDSAASAMSNSGGNVINIPIRLDNGEFVKPNRPPSVQPYTPPPPRPPPPTIPSSAAEPYKPSPPPPQRPSYVPKPPSRYQRAKKTPVEKFGGQDFHELKRKHQSTRQLFVDPAFPASNRLLAEDDDQYVLSYFNRYATNSIQWLRPKVYFFITFIKSGSFSADHWTFFVSGDLREKRVGPAPDICRKVGPIRHQAG